MDKPKYLSDVDVKYLIDNFDTTNTSVVYGYLHSLRQFKQPQRPTKPSLSPLAASYDADAFAKKLKIYEGQLKYYAEDEVKYETESGVIQDLIEAFIKEKSGLNTLPFSQRVKDKIYWKAYSDGHSSGWNEVFGVLIDLVSMLTEE